MQRFELLPDEEIVIENPKHWKNYIMPCVLAFLCFAGAVMRINDTHLSLVNKLARTEVIPTGIVPTVSLIEAITLFLLVISLAVNMIDTAYTRYYVTTKRIISTSGFLNVRMNEMALEKCETVNLTQRFSERVFNSGDILCISAGASIYLDDVYHARDFKQTIMNMITKLNEE